MQIRTRLSLQFTLLVSLILLSAFSGLYWFLSNANTLDFQSRLRDRALTSAVLLLKVKEVDSALLKTIDRAKHDILFGENVSIIDAEGKELYTNNDTTQFANQQEIVDEIKRRGTYRSSKGDYSIIGLRYQDNARQSYYVLAEAIDVEGHKRFRDLRKLLMFIFLAMLAIVAIIGFLYSKRALKPMSAVMNEVETISTDNLAIRLNGGDSGDEIGKLVSIFNRLLDRIDGGFKMQKAFVANVSHELKNPLTKITSQLEVTLLNERESGEYKQVISSVLDDIRELNRLSNGLLDLASLSHEGFRLHTSLVRLDELLWEIRDAVRAGTPGYQVEIVVIDMPSDEAGLCIQANVELLKTALENLVENACKFSGDHRAAVSLICTSDELEVRIFDTGPGIAAKDIANIFQPFYRADNTSKVKGHGIGLSLSQKIIEVHKGTIEIDSIPGQGTQINVIFQKGQKV